MTLLGGRGLWVRNSYHVITNHLSSSKTKWLWERKIQWAYNNTGINIEKSKFLSKRSFGKLFAPSSQYTVSSLFCWFTLPFFTLTSLLFHASIWVNQKIRFRDICFSMFLVRSGAHKSAKHESLFENKIG